MDPFTLHLVFGPLLGHQVEYRYRGWDSGKPKPVQGKLQRYAFDRSDGNASFALQEEDGGERILGPFPVGDVSVANDGQRLIIYFAHGYSMSVSLSP